MKVRDIFHFGGLQNSKLIAGKKGLDREVSSISVLEVTEAKIKDWVLNDQLYLTSFYSITQDVNKQLEMISTLHQNNCSGLILCHLDLFLKKIDKSLIAYCDQKKFPLIVAESHVSYIEIMYPIVSKLMDNKTTEMEALTKMQNRLIELIATKNDVNYIYGSIEKEYGGEILFLDTNGKLIYPRSQNYQIKVRQMLDSQHEGSSTDQYNKHSLLLLGEKKYFHFPIEYHGLHFGTLIAEIIDGKVEACMTKLGYIANLASLVSTRHYRVEEIEKVRKQEYISDLLTWNFRSNDVAIAMGQNIGWDIRNKNRVAIVNINDIQLNINSSKDFARYLEKILYENFKKIIKAKSPNNLIGLRSDTYLLLLEDCSPNTLDSTLSLCQQILDCCKQSFTGSVSIGISRAIANERGIPEAYLQAMDAMRIGRYFYGDNHVTASDHLGFYSLLREIRKISNFSKIDKDLFAPLKDYDEIKNHSLLKTLKILIANQMDTKTAAEVLFVHRNTINYRKQKIIEVLGYCPWEMPYLFNSVLYLVAGIFDE